MTRSRIRCHALLGLLILTLTLAADRHVVASDAVDFNRDIRPILAANCYACHGPDEAERKADLRLDTKAGALADLGGHVALSPGKPDDSELLRRIASTDPDILMPPPDTGKTLTADQIDRVRRWIAAGAEWQEHWAYRQPGRPSAPAVSGTAAFDNPIDLFVRARLAELNLAPAAEADRATLARRLSFDLVGLPPSADEVDAFVNDTTPGAYERLVDRLLASPHYGERMAQYWLDVVRFADTNGYHGDNHRDIGLYRDYVIDAFNRNKPFDQFTVEQLAGDLLADATRETRIASGYNHLLMTTREGGAQAKEYTAKYAADRVRNASTVWLGATMGCAECHDHKFDPFLTKDFYRFAAFFADVKEVAVGPQEQVMVPDDEAAARLADFDRRIATVRQVLDAPTPELAAAQLSWEESVSSQVADWTPLVPTAAVAASGATLAIGKDGAIMAGGEAPASDVTTIIARVKLPGITALRLEALTHKSLPGQGPGRAANGNFVLSEISATAAPHDNPGAISSLALVDPSSGFAQEGFAVTGAIDGNSATGWAIAERTGQEHVAVFQVDGAPAGEETIVTVQLVQRHGAAHNLGRFRLSATNKPRPVRANDGIPQPILKILAVSLDQRTAEQQRALAAHFRGIAPQLAAQRAELAQLDAAKAEFVKVVPTTLVSVPAEPRMMRVLPRGNWLSEAGEVVAPGVPGFLPQMTSASERATRLDLARWLVARDNPLVARVFVNRLWKLAFGQGIVKSLDDFGAQGAPPTHPELLDWLAADLVDNGWDVKHSLKQMVMSATYRQSSVSGAALREVDPDNKWLARQGRYRLDAETVRDNVLAVSGLLSPRIGGPSVKPYQPPGYWSHLNFPVREYEADHGESLYRRGLYTYWCRTFLQPSLLAFDAPTREECTVDRPRSNTPLQALVLLNDPTYVEAARVFAQRIQTTGGADDESRLRWAYRQTLSRAPSAAELTVLAALLAKHRAEFAADPAAAAKLIATGEAPPAAGLDPTELAAWTSVVRALLNLHETITRS